MKKIFIIMITILGLLIFQNCKKEEPGMAHSYQLEQTKQDKDLKNLAKVVSLAISENTEFRKLVKNEALYKFDGDYDILLTGLKKKEITNGKGKNINIGNFLSDYAKKLNIDYKENRNEKSSAQDYIDYLTQLYPNLQVSVPVHAEEWTDEYVPKVTFIPENLQDGQNIDIIAYQNNTITNVNTQNEPDEPVVVIGMNERINPIDDDINDPTPPLFLINWNLQGSQTQSGIRLTWTYNNNNNGNIIIGYHIYRKGTNDNDFLFIGNSYGINNMTYDDNNTYPSAWFSYYITAFSALSESNPSNIINIQAPPLPLAAENFTAQLNNPNEVELRWDNPNGQYIDYTSISKKVTNVDVDYNEIAQINNNTTYYFDNNVIAGKKVTYKINEISNTGYSNSKYDFIKVPFRDVSVPTKVYIEQIKFNWSDIDNIEGWLRGEPEFKFAVVMGSPNNGVTIQDGMIFHFCERHSWNNFNGRNVFDWQPSNWSEVLTFKAIEMDGGPDVDLHLSAKYKTKNADKSGFGADGSISVTIKDFFDSDDENMGIGYLRYYDPTTKWVHFSNYGFKIKISTVDVNEDCWPD